MAGQQHHYDDTRDYYTAREAAERKAAVAATDDCARRAHLDLALRYRMALHELPRVELRP